MAVHSQDKTWPGRYRRYPSLTAPSYVIRKQLAKTIKLAFDSVVNRESVVIDIGCGDKPYYPWVAERVKAYIGVDLRAVHPVDVVALGERLPFVDQCADAVIASQVLEHVPEPDRVLQEMRRLLKDRGHIIVSVPCVYAYHPTPGDYWRWTPEGFQTLLERHGFTVEKIWPNGGLLAASAVLLLVPLNVVANRLARRWYLKPLAWLLWGVIAVQNLLVYLLEKTGGFLTEPGRPNSLPANILALASCRKGNR
jgi:SAM-dependent methyltransferase